MLNLLNAGINSPSAYFLTALPRLLGFFSLLSLCTARHSNKLSIPVQLKALGSPFHYPQLLREPPTVLLAPSKNGYGTEFYPHWCFFLSFFPASVPLILVRNESPCGFSDNYYHFLGDSRSLS